MDKVSHLGDFIAAARKYVRARGGSALHAGVGNVNSAESRRPQPWPVPFCDQEGTETMNTSQDQQDDVPEVERGQIWRHRVTNKRYRVLAVRDGSALLMALDLAGGPNQWRAVRSMLAPMGGWALMPGPHAVLRQHVARSDIALPSNVRTSNVFNLLSRKARVEAFEQAQRTERTERHVCPFDGLASTSPGTADNFHD